MASIRLVFGLRSEQGLLPLVLHLSGPLLEWLERHDAGYLDLLGKLVSADPPP